MKKFLLASAMVVSLSAAAYAGNNNGHNNNGPAGDTINHGGTGIGVGVGIGVGGKGGKGGNASVKNNVSNHNTNLNANINANKNTNLNANNNTNKASANNKNSNAQGQLQGQGQSQSVDGSGNSSVSVEGDVVEAAASSAAPVYLTSSNDTCMGSSALGAQGMNFGVSLGTTWTDSNCIMLKNSRELKVQGHEKAAKARLCMDADNALAFELAGEPCPRTLETARAAQAKIQDWNRIYAQAQVAGIADAPVPQIFRDKAVSEGIGLVE